MKDVGIYITSIQGMQSKNGPVIFSYTQRKGNKRCFILR